MVTQKNWVSYTKQRKITTSHSKHNKLTQKHVSLLEDAWQMKAAIIVLPELAAAGWTVCVH